MRKLNHFSVSFALSFWIFFFIFEKNIIVTFASAFIVAMISWLPDVDISIEKRLKDINRYSFYLMYPITILPRLFFKHRTITHSIWLPLVSLGLTEFYFTNIYLINLLRVFYIAISLHILEDTFTRAGVKVLYPISFKVKFANFSTDSKLHFLFFECCSYVILFSFFGMVLYLNLQF